MAGKKAMQTKYTLTLDAANANRAETSTTDQPLRWNELPAMRLMTP